MRLFFLPFCLVLCFLFSVSVSFGQGTIKGVIVEENEKGELSPLIGANVIWLGTTIGASADTNGVFSLHTLMQHNSLIRWTLIGLLT